MPHRSVQIEAAALCLRDAQGVLDGEIRETCTACATTLLLEFGYLSHLTGVESLSTT